MKIMALSKRFLIKRSKNFKFINQNINHISYFHLCLQYYASICGENNSENNSYTNLWSAFMWIVISYEKIRAIYNDFERSFLPYE